MKTKLLLIPVSAAVAVLGAISTVVLSRTGSEPASSAPHERPQTATAVSSPSTPSDNGYDALPGMDCMVNEYGIRRKALIARRQVRGREKPEGHPIGGVLSYFTPYYVFEEESGASGEVTHFRIGPTPRRNGRLVWIRASDAQAWDHRIAARYAGGRGKRLPPLLIYATKEDAIRSLKPSGGQVEPIARYVDSGNGAKAWMPWPIVDVEHVDVGGGSHELLQLAFLGSRSEGATASGAASAGDQPQYTTEQVETFRANVKKLDVVFVMDTTLSTQRFIDAMKRTVVELAEGMKGFEFQPDLALGLCEYRDYVNGLMFVAAGEEKATRHYPLERNLQTFMQTIDPLKEAGKGSGEFSEAVYDGVLAGLQETEWRGEELSAKILILIGDNSAHDFGHKKNPQGIRPEELAKAAKEKGVRIFSLVVPGGGDRSERARHEQQFQFLAESTGGESLPLSDQSAQSVLESIRAIMKTEAATVHTRSVVFDGMAEGKSKEQIISQHSLNEKEFTAVMEFLNSAGIDPSRFQGGTAFATGWCVAAPGGLPVVEREVFIARSELEMLISELHRLCQNLGAEFGSNIARAGLTGRVDPRSWFGQADQGPFDLWLAAKGIPTSNGLLKLSRHQLDTMAEQTRGQLRDDILRHYIPGLMNLRNDNSRFTLIGNLEWGFVQESKLP